MSDADCTPGCEARSVAASLIFYGNSFFVVCYSVDYFCVIKMIGYNILDIYIYIPRYGGWKADFLFPKEVVMVV